MSVLLSSDRGSVRALEILNLSRSLRREAGEQCESRTRGYFAVHQVMLEAFGAREDQSPGANLHARLSRRLRFYLEQPVAA